MNEVQVRTLEQVRLVLAGTQALEFRATPDEPGRYARIELVLRRFDYRHLIIKRAERGPVLAYLQRLSGFSRAQLTRLVARWVSGKRRSRRIARPSTPSRGATRMPTWRCWPRSTGP